MQQCQTCGSEVGQATPFCSQCGSPLKKSSSGSSPADAPTMAAVIASPDAPTYPPRPKPASRPSDRRSRDEGRFAPGMLIAGRYRIVALLGRGGMGEVFRADDLSLGQPVALINGARLVLTGQGVAPSLFAVMANLGQERTVSRLKKARAM